VQHYLFIIITYTGKTVTFSSCFV